MKVTTSNTTTLPSSRQAFYNKKRSPPSSSSSLAKRKTGDAASPLRDSARRTPPELLAAEVLRHSAQQMALAERDIQNLLELDYQDEVKSYMSEMEARTTASVDLIDQQPELQWYMRPYLVEFLIEIHQQHRLRPETLYLALNIVDRYVSKRIVFKKHYQLVGCAALWIAAKFEDAKDRVPTVPELCQMCCGAYDESAFIQMEGHVLSTIGWVVGHPTAEAWLRLACVTGQLEEQRTQHVARFVMEITLFHKEFIPFKPSELALASLLLARFMLGKSRRVHDESENVLLVAQMLDQHLAEHLDAVSVIIVKKYSFPFYSRASTFVREWYLSGRRFSYYDWTGPHPSQLAPITQQASSSPSSSHLRVGHSQSMRRTASENTTISNSSSPSHSSAFSCASSSRSTAPSSPSSSQESDDGEDDFCCDEDDAEDEEREPYTPNTPYPTESMADAQAAYIDTRPSLPSGPAPMDGVASTTARIVGKENVPKPFPSPSKAVFPSASSTASSRPPLKRASWEHNPSAMSAPILPSFRS